MVASYVPRNIHSPLIRVTVEQSAPTVAIRQLAQRLAIAKQLRIAWGAWSELAERSPKFTGRFRRSWFLSHDSDVEWEDLTLYIQEASEEDTVALDMEAQTGRVASYGQYSPEILPLFLTQVCPYWYELNKTPGISKQAPGGFIQRSINRAIVKSKAVVIRQGQIVDPSGSFEYGGLPLIDPGKL